MKNIQKTVVLTGGTGKLGLFASRYLFDKGYKVIVCSRDLSVAERTCKNILSSNGILTTDYKNKLLVPQKLDLASEKSIDNFLAELSNKGIIPNAIVNAAAVDNQDSIEDINYKDIEEILKINFIGSAYLSSKIVSTWKEFEIEGVFCTISTLLTKLGCDKSSIYASSKAALESFFINLAVECGKYNIRSNIIRIAGMLGEVMYPKDLPRCNSLIQDTYLNTSLNQNNIPLRRFGDFEEFASLIEFLISDASLYITGQAINIDGGLSIVYPGYSL